MESKLQQAYLDVQNTDSIDMLRIEVQDVLGRLKWKDQVLLKMRMSGMSYSQIAEALDISIGSVGTMLVRAMKRFRLEYEEKEAVKTDEMPGGHSIANVFRR
jgi:DNA-directed RNA polymerase specialized sigma24 family protein